MTDWKKLYEELEEAVTPPSFGDKRTVEECHAANVKRAAYARVMLDVAHERMKELGDERGVLGLDHRKPKEGADSLRAQLAASEAKASRLREACEKAHNEIATGQGAIDACRLAFNTLTDALTSTETGKEAERDAWKAKAERLQAELNALWAARCPLCKALGPDK